MLLVWVPLGGGGHLQGLWMEPGVSIGVSSVGWSRDGQTAGWGLAVPMSLFFLF